MCQLCDGSGLIPLVKDGKVVANAWVYCECYDEYGEPYPHRYTPDMFDFPMSYSYYRGLCQLHGWPDPGPDRYTPDIPPEPQPQVIEHRHSDMSQKDFASLRQLEGQVKYLERKLTEKERQHLPQRKPTYKGIR